MPSGRVLRTSRLSPSMTALPRSGARGPESGVSCCGIMRKPADERSVGTAGPWSMVRYRHTRPRTGAIDPSSRQRLAPACDPGRRDRADLVLDQVAARALERLAQLLDLPARTVEALRQVTVLDAVEVGIGERLE